MFKKLRNIFRGSKSIKEKEESENNGISVIDPVNMATKGMGLKAFVNIDAPLLELSSGMSFELGIKDKLITGVSTEEARGRSFHRYYTQDEYFFQIEFFGEDRHDNLERLALFTYLEDEGQNLDSASEEDKDYWKDVIDNSQEYVCKNNTYNRVSDVLGGLEVVIMEDDVNTIDNTFAVFSRTLPNKLEEYIIVNAEQEVEVDDNYNITDHTSLCVSVAIGVDVSHNNLRVLS